MATRRRPVDASARRGIVAVLSALLPLISCGDAGTDLESSPIGEEGGTTTLAGGALTLSVPRGALATSVAFTAEAADSVPQTDLLVPGSAYLLGPSGTGFGKAATLTLRYDPKAIPEGVRESELGLHEVVGAQWRLATGSSVDTVQHIVSGRIGNVGRFAALGRAATLVTLHPSRYTLGAGDAVTFFTTVRGPSGALFPERKHRWTSSDGAVATVDASGRVTAVGGGTATITASVEGAQAQASVSVFDCGAQGRVPAAECLALVDVYDAITQSEWRTTLAWVTGGDPCAWRGVTCRGGTVAELRLPSGQYQGTLSPALGQLTGLIRLDLSGNRLSGPIPAGSPQVSASGGWSALDDPRILAQFR